MAPSFLALLTCSFGAVGFAACSSDDASDTNPGVDSGGSTDIDSGSPNDDGGPTTGDSGVPDPGIPGPTACPTKQFKTLVVVGDSISDVGGSGDKTKQEPFYRTLLVKNDNALYPEWTGFDLSTCWGLDPTAGVVKVSLGGAIATVPATNDPTDKHILLNQVTSLPATLEGPVLVIGTIGGNDVTAGLITVLTGTPQQAQAVVDNYVAGFGAALTELTKPDRFGAGVQTSVLITNIYDPSGGTGHFFYEPGGATCPGPFSLYPDGTETATKLAPFNNGMVTEAAKHTGVKVLDMNTPFVAHSVSMPAASNWFFEDCIHPDTAGHNAIRGIFWAGMVGL